MMILTDSMVVWLPDGYCERLFSIAKDMGVTVDYLIRDALEHTYIMSEEQRKMLQKSLPF